MTIICMCPKCRRPVAPTSKAEYLIELYRELMRPRDLIIEAVPGTTSAHVAIVSVAVRFAALPAAVRFRAMVEDWTLDEIVRRVNS